MNFEPEKSEREALLRLLLLATSTNRIVGMGFKPFGDEFRAAMNLVNALKERREFDPDLDAW